MVAREGREGAIQVWEWEAQTSGSKFGSRMYNMGWFKSMYFFLSKLLKIEIQLIYNVVLNQYVS